MTMTAFVSAAVMEGCVAEVSSAAQRSLLCRREGTTPRSRKCRLNVHLANVNARRLWREVMMELICIFYIILSDQQSFC